MRPHYIRWGLFVLLAVNSAIYVFFGRLSEAIDSVAWYALLVLFEIEAHRPAQGWRTGTRWLLTLLRLVAAAGISVAAVAYLREREWLDAINVLLWIGVVIMLEIEVRLSSRHDHIRQHIPVVSYALYAGLALIAATWLSQGDWLDAYDALLWIAAFALIEMNLLKHFSRPA